MSVLSDYFLDFLVCKLGLVKTSYYFQHQITEILNLL